MYIVYHKFTLQVFYELMCLTTFSDLNAPYPDLYRKYPRYHVLTVTKWFAKELCKIPLYMELGFYYKNDNFLKYLWYSLFTLFGFGFIHLLSSFFINKPNTLVFVMIILITIVGVCLGISKCTVTSAAYYTDELLLFIVYGIFELICGYFLLKVIMDFNGYTMGKFLYSLANLGAGGLLMLLFLADDPPPIATIMKVAWKIINVISVIVYVLDVTYQQNEFSFLLVVVDILVITSVILITLNHRSAYAVMVTILLILIHLISVLYKYWSNDSSVFLVTQATCQLTIVGALLYTNGYNYGRKSAE